jgi:hypothetical protein
MRHSATNQVSHGPLFTDFPLTRVPPLFSGTLSHGYQSRHRSRDDFCLTKGYVARPVSFFLGGGTAVSKAKSISGRRARLAISETGKVLRRRRMLRSAGALVAVRVATLNHFHNLCARVVDCFGYDRCRDDIAAPSNQARTNEQSLAVYCFFRTCLCVGLIGRGVGSE